MKKRKILIGILSVAMLASCNGGQGGGNNNNTPDAFEIVTDLDEEKEIHTAAQKEYLSYDGVYKTIDPSLYPNGNGAMTDSEPKAVKIEWDFDVPEDKELDYYTVSFDQTTDIANPYVVKGTTAKSLDLYNVYLGTNFFKVTANYKDGTKEDSNIYQFDVEQTAPRNLQIEGMTNCRDMGGRELMNGGKIRQGLIYRTSGVVGNYPSQVTENGIDVLKNKLGVKTEINVADQSTYNGTGNGWEVVDCLMNYNQDKNSTGNSKGTNHHFSRNAESVKKVFSLLADEDNYPVFYHCRIGTDRTGLVAILVNGLLGVSENEIYQDYLFSNFGKIGSKRYIGTQAGEDNIENYMKEIEAMPGASWAQKTYNTLLAVGVPASTLDAVIDILTVGEKFNGEDGQKIGMGSVLQGAAMKTSSDRFNPAEYYTLAANESVTWTFETATAYNAYLTAYLGIASSSTSNKLADAIKVELDNEEMTVANKNYFECGFGNLNINKQDRTCYYFNNIGEKNIAAGSHTLKLTAKVANVNVGGFGVFKK